MPTKPKTAGSMNATSGKSLEALFSEALELLDQKAYDKAIAALEHLQAEAMNGGQLGMVRSVKGYISAIKMRSEKKEAASGSPEMLAQLALNCGKADEALSLLGDALKTVTNDARLFYLKATAHAQKEEAEAAAEALKQAVTLNQDFLHQFRLEKDFDRVRYTGIFTSLGME